jgi:hypothetical protein
MASRAYALPGDDHVRRFESWCGDTLGGDEIARYGYSTISFAIKSGSEIAQREKITVRITEKRRKKGNDLSAICEPDGTVYLATRHGGEGLPAEAA